MKNEKYFLHSTSIVDEGATIREGTKIWHYSHIQSGAKIGSSCSLGQNVNIANNVSIGDHVKIQNNVSVYEGVTIEDYEFCRSSCVFTNDLTPRSRYPKNHHYQPTIIRHDATIGANATIVFGHEIGHHATIVAGAVVTSNVPPHALMAGVPAKQIGWVCECGQVLQLSEGKADYFTCPDCGRYYFLYSGTLSLDRSKPVRRVVNGETIVDNKIYYMETNALYKLINHLDEILSSGVNVATSVYALYEVVYGIQGPDEKDYARSYNRRRAILRKIEDSNFFLYPYTLRECVATAFNVDISQRPEIQAEKKALWDRRKLITECTTYEEYAERAKNELGIDVEAEKKADDIREQNNKKIINEQIKIDRDTIESRRKEEEKGNYQFTEIDWEKAFGILEDETDDEEFAYEPDINSDEAKLLIHMLDSLHISYTDEEIKEKLVEFHKGKNKNALVAMLLGNQLYGGSKALNISKTDAGVNDVADLSHLLYLRDENHVIVSDDKIFEIATIASQRIKCGEFLKMCQESRIATREDGNSCEYSKQTDEMSDSDDDKDDKTPNSPLIPRLFIIGNGFDKAHGYATSYSDFRSWMEERLMAAYPELQTDQDGHVIIEASPVIPDVFTDHHGDEIANEGQALYLLMWLLIYNTSMDDEWYKFEEALYYLDLEAVINENDWFVESSSRDKEGDLNPFYTDDTYSQIAEDMKTSVLLLPKLFSCWIEDVSIEPVKPSPVSDKTIALMNEEALYLSTDYTETLEKIYGVPGRCIDHIHGLRLKAAGYYDADSVFPNTIGKIIVGHGEDESREFNAEYVQKEMILQEIIRDLRKPVDEMINKHREFWSWIFHGDVKEVYSYGFSYSDVDMYYIGEIVRSLNGFEYEDDEDGIERHLIGGDWSKEVTWYLHKYGDKVNPESETGATYNEEYEEKVRACGFKGKFARFE